MSGSRKEGATGSTGLRSGGGGGHSQQLGRGSGRRDRTQALTPPSEMPFPSFFFFEFVFYTFK